jgi:hypothetical protein
MGAIEDATSEVEDTGMSTKKKVAAGAAIGVAVPAAVGVAKKLLGNGDDESETGQARSSSRRRSSSGSRGRTTGTARRTSSTARRSASTRRSSGATSGTRERTKEQLYNQAKRLNIEGRSKMTKAQLQRAVSRAKS